MTPTECADRLKSEIWNLRFDLANNMHSASVANDKLAMERFVTEANQNLRSIMSRMTDWNVAVREAHAERNGWHVIVNDNPDIEPRWVRPELRVVR